MLATGLLLSAGWIASASMDAARDRLEELIAETNALEAVHVEFRMECKCGDGRLQFDYRAPDAMRWRHDSPHMRLDLGCSDSVLWNVYFPAVGEDYQARVDLLDGGGPLEEALALFERDFWRPPEGHRVSLGFAWTPADGAVETSTWVGYDATDGYRPGVLLGWLDTQRELDGELSIEGDELVHRSPGAEVRVDASTGFLTSMRMRMANGENVRITLERIDLDPEHDGDSFAAPQLDPDVEDSSAPLRAWLLNARQLRENAMRHVHRLATRGSDGIDPEAEEELRGLLTALVRRSTVEHYASWMEGIEANNQEFADWLGECVDQGDDREQLEEAARERRTQLEELVDPEKYDFGSPAPADPDGLADDPLWLELREVEDDARRAVYASLVAEPLLDHFDQVVEAALDD